MQLTHLKIIGFKSHHEAEFEFSNKLNCFVGLNGVGKTNVLEAIYFLCMTKAHSGLSDKQLVNHERDFFRLDGRFRKHGSVQRIVAKFPQHNKKVLEVDGQAVAKMAEHIGRFPVVMIAPDDVQLVTEGGEMRRKFMDTTLSQTSQDYLMSVVQYNNLLKQRNALLKHAAETGHLDHGLLDIYDQQLIAPSEYIFRARKAFFEDFAPVFARRYAEISGQREEVAVRYESILDDQPLHETLLQRRERDRIMQRTTQGIHRDELVMLLDGQPVRDFGSQGQLKSYLLSLRLAQYAYLVEACGVLPILLMDDIFDKLDMQRVAALVKVLHSDDYGQIFMTDTQQERMKAVTDGVESRFFNLP